MDLVLILLLSSCDSFHIGGSLFTYLAFVFFPRCPACKLPASDGICPQGSPPLRQLVLVHMDRRYVCITNHFPIPPRRPSWSPFARHHSPHIQRPRRGCLDLAQHCH